MNTRTDDQSGFALATAILALLVVGGLVTAGFYAASNEARLGIGNAQADLAFHIAEQGMQNVLGTTKKRELRNLTTGQTLNRNGTVTVGGRTVGEYKATIRPFGDDLYLVESLGTVTQGGRYAGAKRRIGTFVRTLDFVLPMGGALTTYGGIGLRGNATITGADQPPTQWPDSLCDAAAAAQSGIRTTTSSTVSYGTSTTVQGDPPLERDATLSTSEFDTFGDTNLQGLIAMANVRVPGGSTLQPQPQWSGTSCTHAIDNWGEVDDALNPCYSYFPIIHSAGNLTLSGQGEGQGILIVEGDLSISGTFRFYGFIIVTGRFNNAQGSGSAEIYGSLITMSNADIDETSEFRGTPVIQYSTCSVTRAAEENDAVSRLVPLQWRSWVDMSGAGVQEN